MQPGQAGLNLSVDALPLGLLQPCLAALLRPALTGSLSLNGRLDWSDGSAAPAWQALVLSQARVDLPVHRISVGRLQLQGPRLAVARDSQGRLDAETWLVAAPAAPARPAAPASTAPPWQLQTRELRWQDGHLTLRRLPLHLLMPYADAALPVLLQSSRSGLPGPVAGQADADMRSRLLAQTEASDDAARDLALRRSLAVRDALAARGLPADRLFLAGAQLRAPDSADAAWTPRVDLKLSPR